MHLFFYSSATMITINDITFDRNPTIHCKYLVKYSIVEDGDSEKEFTNIEEALYFYNEGTDDAALWHLVRGQFPELLLEKSSIPFEF
jgi:hypothetical protein